MGIYEHSCDAVGKRDNERDLGCVVTPKVSFYVEITHFPCGLLLIRFGGNSGRCS
jgi:hypothetical protein